MGYRAGRTKSIDWLCARLRHVRILTFRIFGLPRRPVYYDPDMSEERAVETVYSLEGEVQEALISRINHVEGQLLQMPTVQTFVPLPT